MTSGDELLSIGRIARPHGIRGDLRVRPGSNDYDHFAQCIEIQPLYVWQGDSESGPIHAPESEAPLPLAARLQDRPRGPVRIQVDSVQRHGGYAIVTFREIGDRETAESLGGWLLGLAERDAPPAEEGSFYHHDLEGLEVLDAGDGRVLGRVESIDENPAHALLLVRPPERGATPFLLPFVSEFVKSVDVEGGRMHVLLPRGLTKASG